MTPNWNLVVDVAKCNACHNCVIATRDEYLGNTFPGYSAPAPPLGQGLLSLERSERGQRDLIDVSHRVMTCQQCAEPACVTPATADVMIRRPDGIVLIDPVKARGRKDIPPLCPYGQIIWNEELDLPQKWSFDAHLLDSGWSRPRCVDACPTGALDAVLITDEGMARRSAAENLRQLWPETGCRPRVHYRNLDRFDRCLLAGSLYRIEGEEEVCAEGMVLELRKQGALVATTVSDCFGDYRFDGLLHDLNECELVVIDPSDKTQAASWAVTVTGSLSLAPALIP